MPQVITYGGDTKIGAYMFPDRKKSFICVQKGNQIAIYGTFNSIESADKFMNELADFLGAKAGGQE